MHTSRRTVAALLLFLGAAVPWVSDADPALKPRSSHRTAPPLELLDQAGKRHALDEYRGRVVLVNFFGTWCPPCLQEMPSLLLLAKALEGRPFAVLAVAIGDSPARLRQVFGEQRAGFTVLLDSTGRAARSWQALAFPTSFVLDPEGRIRYSAEGPVAWDDPEVARQIAALLPKLPARAAESGKASQPAVPRSD
jgi:thiol-disulfide isomerase/thioredoxin